MGLTRFTVNKVITLFSVFAVTYGYQAILFFIGFLQKNMEVFSFTFLKLIPLFAFIFLARPRNRHFYWLLILYAYSILHFLYIGNYTFLGTSISTYMDLMVTGTILYFYSVSSQLPRHVQEALITAIGISYSLKSLILVISYIFGIGEYTYMTEDGLMYGFGTKSFFVGGNVIGLTQVLISLIFVFLAHAQNKKFYAVLAIMIAIGAIFVGNRTGLLLGFIILALASVYLVLSSIWLTFVTLISVTSCFAFLPVIEVFDLVVTNIFSYDRIQEKFEQLFSGSARGDLTSETFIHLERNLSMLGKGPIKFMSEISAQIKTWEAQRFSWTESDLADIVGMWGIFGYMLISSYWYMAFRRSFTSHAVISVVVFGLLLVHSVFAGHVWVHSQVAQSVMIMLLAIHGMSRPNNDGAEE